MRYRKKPIVIEALRFDGSVKSAREIENWSRGSAKLAYTAMKVKTLEGEMTAEIGDWIIKGVKGEFYPCKPEIFSMTYELAEPTAAKAEGGR